MAAQLLDGKGLAENIRNDLFCKIQARKAHCPDFVPGLAVVQIGNHSASSLYVKYKRQACKAIGIQSFKYDLPDSTTESALIQLIEKLNIDPSVHGILIQLPIPPNISQKSIFQVISPDKDVDGFHPYHMGNLVQSVKGFRPCTPYGVMRLLQANHVEVIGKHAVVVGASTIVGRPMALELLNAQATVTICHDKTKQLDEHIKQADLLIVSIGNPHVIQADWIKPGAVVVDVGINHLFNGKLVGDVPFESVFEKASWITPVPGGVGPMTVAMLLENTYEASIA